MTEIAKTNIKNTIKASLLGLLIGAWVAIIFTVVGL
jgi:hypothetical protein